MSLIVVGVDPSVANCGLGVVDRHSREILHLETVRTDTDAHDLDRYCQVFSRVLRVLRKFRARAMAIEKQTSVQTGAWERGEINADNSKTLIVFGAACGAAWSLGLHVEEVTPQQAKIAVLGPGRGNAEKAEVKAAVTRMLGANSGRFSVDAADGVAIACAPPLVKLAIALR